MIEGTPTNDCQPPSTESTLGGPSPEGSGPSEAQRASLIRNLQVHALTQAHPMAANLQMLSADLFQHMSRLCNALQKENPDSPSASPGFKNYERKLETMLKVARQIDRFAQVERLYPGDSEACS